MRNQFQFILLTTCTVVNFIPTISDAQSFTKVLNGPVVNTPGDSRSVNWADVNADGWIDLMITNGPNGGQNNFLYINDGNGNFVAISEDVITLDDQPSDGATFADTDNDGDLDAFVANWYNTENMFYINNGNGNFTQNTGVITDSGGYCETAAWGDYDGDGLVDIYVTNSAGINKNLLYHNEGNNLFQKIEEGDVVNDIHDSRGVTWSDIDFDGDLDLFVVNENNQGQNIYRNDQGISFYKVLNNDLITNMGTTMSGSWADYDNDGDFDVFLAREGMNNALFRNEGSFYFTHMDEDTVSNDSGHSFSSAWSDIDNDADLDLFVTNSFYTNELQQNFLYSNNGDGTFTRIDNSAPATDSTWAYGCAFGDYDNDGFQDLAVATVRFNGQDQNDLLYHNDGNSNNWITLTLTGTAINTSAIGAKVWAVAMINGNEVWQVREISSQTSYCGQNDIRAHFGLADAEIIQSIVVEWSPGELEFFSNITPNQFLTIVQGEGIVGYEEHTIPASFELFPNPSSDSIRINNLSMDQNSWYQYDIVDIHGKTVLNGILHNNSIDICNLPTGSYVLKLYNGEMEEKQCFIKMR